MEVIGLRDVRFSYPGGKTVFRDLCLSLSREDRVSISGPNGSGKTTLLSLIMGLSKAEQGEIRLFGRRMLGGDDFAQARKRMGYLFQDPDDQLFCPVVEEDIAFGPLNLGMSTAQARIEVDRVCAELGIEDLKESYTFKLSFGEKRLVALAGVLAMNPEILLLDEPTASIDGETRQRIGDYLNRYQGAILCASHDEGFLMTACHRHFSFKTSFVEPTALVAINERREPISSVS